MFQDPSQSKKDDQYYQDQQEINEPMMNQQQHGFNEFSVQQNQNNYSETTQTDQEVNLSLMGHINYVRQTHPSLLFNEIKNYPKNLPNDPSLYNVDVQTNLPFRIDAIRIENLYDASRPNVYKDCFLDPISEDNQFQGWSESRLSNHPFMNSLKEICGSLDPNINNKLIMGSIALIALTILDVVTLQQIVSNDGSSFLKFVGIMASLSYLIICFMMSLQVTRILRGFGSLSKLFSEFLVSLIILVLFQTPLIFYFHHQVGFLPFLEAFVEIMALLFLKKQNERQILANAQIYLLVTGHIKQQKLL